ncbi:hypothetical protein HN604_03865 [archaeon]|mgnify:CR=1 FL=1|jgi:hypothetical protein|nr:hypothetical protein [archaeon]MBT6182303.1 hypothetical protein [archaeon]MBT6606286.1 hypothetical protein [archaeon]MBT7251545.1 hypothetical protein [archaeon]MBT7661186.1 hypothetical protein [archaeon]
MKVSHLKSLGVVLLGTLIVTGVLLKTFGLIDISSDWFWLLAGLGLAIEGLISLKRQKRFDKRYKITKR